MASYGKGSFNEFPSYQGTGGKGKCCGEKKKKRLLTSVLCDQSCCLTEEPWIILVDLDKSGYQVNIFLFLQENLCCWYSLEVLGTSNEYQQHRFSWRIRKNINTFWIEKNILSRAVSLILGCPRSIHWRLQMLRLSLVFTGLICLNVHLFTLWLIF